MECLRGLSPDQRLTMNLLEAIDAILKLDEIMGWSKTDRSMAYLFERTGGLDVLDEVQKNPNFQIYKQAAEITSKYFEVEETMQTSAPQ